MLPPLRYLKYARAGLQQAVRSLDQCLQLAPTAPWSARPQGLLTQIQALKQGELVQVMADVEAYFEADPEANIPADESVDDHKDRDGTVDHNMPEVEVPAEEGVDEANNRDGAVDQDIPELDVEHESAAASNLTTSLGPALNSESQVPAEWKIGVLPCGRCESTQTRRAKESGRIYCDDCYAVYNPSDGHWRPGKRAKDCATSTLGVGLW